MDELLTIRLAAQDGVVTTADVRACGFDHHGLAALVRSGRLRRIRASVFVDGLQHAGADAASRHVLAARAVARVLGSGYALSHLTAVAFLGIPVLESDIKRVHLSLVGSGKPRCDGRIEVHPALDPSFVTPCQGVPVVNPATAVVQCAARSGLRAGLIAADAALASGRVTVTDLEVALGAARLGPGRRSAHEAVRLADAGSESPGESWSRLVFAQLGLPRPTLQAEIRDDSGRFVARVDFLFEEARIVVEFDGLVKYAGAQGRDALAAEKTREDRLRRLGYVVVRLTWADLRDPARVRTILRDAWRVAA